MGIKTRDNNVTYVVVVLVLGIRHEGGHDKDKRYSGVVT